MAGGLCRTVAVFAIAALAAGLDCHEAARAATDACDAYGADSQACHLLQLHHTARCAAGLGESQVPGEAPVPVGSVPNGGPSVAATTPAVTPAPQPQPTVAEPMFAASTVRDLHETVALANKVYDAALKCKCPAKPEPEPTQQEEPIPGTPEAAQALQEKIAAILESKQPPVPDKEKEAKEEQCVTCFNAFQNANGCAYYKRGNPVIQEMPVVCQDCFNGDMVKFETRCTTLYTGPTGTLPRCPEEEEGVGLPASNPPPTLDDPGAPGAPGAPAVGATPGAPGLPPVEGAPGAGVYLGEANMPGEGIPTGSGSGSGVQPLQDTGTAGGMVGVSCENYDKDAFYGAIHTYLNEMGNDPDVTAPGETQKLVVDEANEARCSKCEEAFHEADGCGELLQGAAMDKIWPGTCTGCGGDALKDKCEAQKREREEAELKAKTDAATAGSPLPPAVAAQQAAAAILARSANATAGNTTLDPASDPNHPLYIPGDHDTSALSNPLAIPGDAEAPDPGIHRVRMLDALDAM